MVTCECTDPSPLPMGEKQFLAMDQSLCVRWLRLVEQCTRLELTMPNDKLSALSGIAQLFFHARNLNPNDSLGRYLAGIWEGDLVRSLAWYVQGKSPRRKLLQYRAPSWSWVTVEGTISSVYFEETSSKLIAKVISSNCTPSTVDPFGKISHGVLELETTVLQLTPDFDSTYCLQLSIEINATILLPVLRNDSYSSRASTVLDHFKTYTTILERGAMDVDCAVLKCLRRRTIRALVLSREIDAEGIATFTRIGFVHDRMPSNSTAQTALSEQYRRPRRKLRIL